MATLTIRNIDDTTMERLRVRATAHSHSIEEEALLTLKLAVSGIAGNELWKLSRQIFGDGQGIDLEPPLRSGDRDLPDFANNEYGQE